LIAAGAAASIARSTLLATSPNSNGKSLVECALDDGRVGQAESLDAADAQDLLGQPDHAAADERARGVAWLVRRVEPEEDGVGHRAPQEHRVVVAGDNRRGLRGTDRRTGAALHGLERLGAGLVQGQVVGDHVVGLKAGDLGDGPDFFCVSVLHVVSSDFRGGVGGHRDEADLLRRPAGRGDGPDALPSSTRGCTISTGPGSRSMI
jgi:hypothetical protein